MAANLIAKHPPIILDMADCTVFDAEPHHIIEALETHPWGVLTTMGGRRLTHWGSPPTEAKDKDTPHTSVAVAELLQRHLAGEFRRRSSVHARLDEIIRDGAPDSFELLARACMYLGINGSHAAGVHDGSPEMREPW